MSSISIVISFFFLQRVRSLFSSFVLQDQKNTTKVSMCCAFYCIYTTFVSKQHSNIKALKLLLKNLLVIQSEALFIKLKHESYFESTTKQIYFSYLNNITKTMVRL